MRKVLLCVLALAIGLVITGCGEDMENTEKAIPVSAVTEEDFLLVPDVQVTESAKIEDFISMHQNPDLPTGCEITSLAMTLSYYGIYADKCDLADNYLEKGRIEEGQGFRDAFIGNPRDPGAFGCFAPVITRSANTYLEKLGSPLRAYNITGTELEGLFPFICGNVPVIVWGTIDCSDVYATHSWEIKGGEVVFPVPEHCMVLVGYDSENVYVADPYHGDIRPYNMEVFKDRYNKLFKQSIVLR